MSANVNQLNLINNAANAVGSDDDNVIWGNVRDNVIEGGKGADEMHGGGGNDTVSYEHSSSGVTVHLDVATPVLNSSGMLKVFHYGTGSGGDAQGDWIYEFSNVVGSAFNDKLYGTASNNTIEGGKGADMAPLTVGEAPQASYDRSGTIATSLRFPGTKDYDHGNPAAELRRRRVDPRRRDRAQRQPVQHSRCDRRLCPRLVV